MQNSFKEEYQTKITQKQLIALRKELDGFMFYMKKEDKIYAWPAVTKAILIFKRILEENE